MASTMRAILLIMSVAALSTAETTKVKGMTKISGGTFFMGTDAKDQRDGEGPVKRVRLMDIG